MTEPLVIEQALQRSEAFLRAIFDSTPVMFWYKDTKNNLLRVNPSAAALEGKRPEEIEGRSSFELYPREQAEAFWRDDLEVISTGKPKLGFVEPHTSPGTGETRWLQVGKVPAFDARNEVVGVIAFGVDVTQMKRAEEALRESETRNRALLKALPDLLFVISNEGRLLDVQAPSQSELMEPKEKVLGRLFSDLLPEGVSARMDSAIRECQASPGGVAFEYDLEAHGEKKFYEARLVPYTERSILALVRNISDRKRSESILQKTQADLKRLTDNMRGVISETDLEGTFLFASQSHSTVSGWREEDLLGKNATDFVHPADGASFREELKQGAEAGALRSLVYRWRCADGRYLWVETSPSLLRDAKGLPQGWVFVTRDVTQRKCSEMVLGLLQEVDRKILQHEGVDAILEFVCREISARLEYPLVWVGTKEPDGRIRPRASAGAARDYLSEVSIRWDDTLEGQGPAGKAVRTGIPQVIQKIDAESLFRYAEVARAWNLASIVGFPLVSKAGPFGVLMMYSSRQTDFDAHTQNLLQRFADQLALSFLEGEQLERIQLQSAALEQKNDELVRFTYAVSHDLKSPLVTIKAFLGYLEKDMLAQDSVRIARDISYIRNAADKMGKLLEELLDLSRAGRQMVPLVDVPLQEAVKEAVDLVAGRISTRGVAIHVTDDPVVLHGDRARLVDLFQNLLDNAVKFMGDQTEPRIDVLAELEGNEIVVVVRDNGIGIDPRFHGRLFGLFEKLQPKTEGTGVGLALVKRIVEVHGGTIRANSEGPGKGTAFRFTLAGTRGTKAL